LKKNALSLDLNIAEEGIKVKEAGIQVYYSLFKCCYKNVKKGYIIAE